MNTVTVPSQTTNLVGYIAANKERIVSRVMTETPQLALLRQSRSSALLRQHIDQLLSHIASALSFAEPEILSLHTGWLQTLSSAHSQSHLDTATILHALQIILTDKASNTDARLLNTIVENGLEALGATDKETWIPNLPTSPGSATHHTNLVTALVGANHRQATDLVLDAMEDGNHLSQVSVDLIQPAMYEIGNLWQRNMATVAQEHLATSICQNILAKAYANATFRPPRHKQAVFAAVAGNFHVLGMRMISDAFETEGWDVHHLGADTPLDALIKMLDTTPVDLLGLAISMNTQISDLVHYLDVIRHEMGARRPAVAIGGLPFLSLPGLAQKLDADIWLKDAEEARQQAQ